MKDKKFWNTVKRNKELVKTWPKWMQKIVITAENCSTGKFIMSEKDWKKQYETI